MFIPFLFFHFAIIQASARQFWVVFLFSGGWIQNPSRNELFGNSGSCFFGHPAPSKLFFADMNDSIQKGAVR